MLLSTTSMATFNKSGLLPDTYTTVQKFGVSKLFF